MILLSLASKQIWPHVLTAARLKPERLFLLHSQDANESQGPAQRLKRFFDDTGLVPRGGTRLELVPHDDFNGIERALDVLQAKHQLALADCRLNFTGGNKLMATAAFRWAARRGVSAFYLERGNQLTCFEPRDGEMQTRPEKMDGHVADEFDPLALLRCQLEASEVERGGEILALNRKGLDTTIQQLARLLAAGADPLRFLVRAATVAPAAAKGDRLEFTTAVFLLKCGVNGVRRSVRLKVKPSQGMKLSVPHAEIDLLFNYGGRLWLVDCKDRKPAENLIDGLWPFVQQDQKVSGSKASQLIGRIAAELGMSQTKVLKEDLVAIREIGGLLGRAVCVRRSRLPVEVEEYARLNAITLIYRDALVTELPRILERSVPRP